MAELRRIVIVGGGTSGWLSAAYLAKYFLKPSKGKIEITLIESSDIGTIGVGEATIPGIRDTIQELGFSEKDFMKSCNATFKQAIKFVDWLKLPENGKSHYYYHNFSEPLRVNNAEPYAPYWVLDRENHGVDYAYASTIQSQICDMSLAPKLPSDKEFAGPLHYAYHFDAGLFAKFLAEESKKNGVKHLIGNVEEVVLDDRGHITHLETKEHGRLEGDLFIDCSGFGGLLIGKTLGTEFTSLNDVLFVDSAVAAQVPYETPDAPINSTTISTAQENGWTWDIALRERRGTGYVYSSKYTDQDRAEEVLRNYLGKQGEDANVRHLKMRIGYREQQWKNNCVAIGLSAGFLEPLESTGIYLVEIALRSLKQLLPLAGDMEHSATQFNKLMVSQFTGTVDFIKLHYVLTQRRDTQFWIDNANLDTCTDTLREFLARIEHRVPNIFDLPIGPQVFTIHSYLAILYGMERYPDLSALKDNLMNWEKARRMPREVDQIWKRAKAALPTHREIVEYYHKQ